MERTRLVVIYDDTQYHDRQTRPRTVTIESIPNEALTQLTKEPIQVTGTNKTDLGAHARGNVAVFDTESQIPPDRICMILNQRLLESTRIQVSEEVPSNWHPKKCTCAKTRKYRILNRRISMPMERLYSYFCYYKLDVDRMRAAANMLAGEHDFRSFYGVRTQVADTVRTVYKTDVEKDDSNIITTRVTGNDLLYNMVRVIVGTLMAVGIGHIQTKDMPPILGTKDRWVAGPIALTRGLTLIEMRYEL